MQVKYIKDTFAHKSEGIIYLNEDLPTYTKLHDAVLEHERSHELHDNFTFKDFFLDLFASGKLPKDEFKAWKKTHKDVVRRMMMPYNKFGFNANITIFWVLIITSVVGIVWMLQNLI